MDKKELTIGSLYYFASMDSPEAYREYRRSLSNNLMKEALYGAHNDIARLLHSEYCTEFVCSSISNKTWYQFNKHLWEYIEDGVFLREKLSSSMVRRFRIYKNQIVAESTTEDDDNDDSDDKKNLLNNSQYKKVVKLIENLKTC